MPHTTIPKRPWRERCCTEAEIGWSPAGTMTSFFEGAALLAANPYLLWRLENLRFQLRVPDTAALPRVVHFLCRSMLPEPEYREDGIYMLYSILIEPFRLIRRI